MDDALVVRELQCVANLRHDGQCLARGNTPAREQLSQIHAIHEFHEKIKLAGRAALLCRLIIQADRQFSPTKLIKRHDAGMVELGKGLGFAGETLGKRRVIANARRQDFQRDDTIQLLLPCLVNRAHAAFADKFENVQLGEQRCEFRDGRRTERGLFCVGDSVRRRTHFKQTGGTKAGKRSGREQRPALRTFDGNNLRRRDGGRFW